MVDRKQGLNIEYMDLYGKEWINFYMAEQLLVMF